VNGEKATCFESLAGEIRKVEYITAMEWLREMFAHPLTQGMNIDDVRTTQLRLLIIREKGLLRQIYESWYGAILQQLPVRKDSILELGSGAGFLADFVPSLITSDILHVSNVNVVLDAHALPFASRTLSAIVMVDVLHHLSDVRRFFVEATRCVKGGGRIIMIEPWVTSWSRFVYGKFHLSRSNPSAPTGSLTVGVSYPKPMGHCLGSFLSGTWKISSVLSQCGP